MNFLLEFFQIFARKFSRELDVSKNLSNIGRIQMCCTCTDKSHHIVSWYYYHMHYRIRAMWHIRIDL